MIVTRHALNRLKKHKLVPKSTSGDAAKNFVKRLINNETISVKRDYKTGAVYRINPVFTAVMFGSRVVTVYPSNIGSNENYESKEDAKEINGM